MTDGTTTWSYTYDANGMRTSRSNGTKTYNYVYNGSQLTQMTVGNDTLYFTYGILGPNTVTWNGTTYYYALNAQGDVTGIFDWSGHQVVTYNWDNAWGYNPIPEGVMASTLGTLNPLRYRGYVYDNETGYYYLQSRYYDPEIGRFINADAFIATGQGFVGNNMFAYCGNNPVNKYDPSGHMMVYQKLLGGGFSNGDAEEDTPLRDVTEEINNALYSEALKATAQRIIANRCSDLLRLAGEAYIYIDFYTKVDHDREWDIKLKDPWEKTIGTTYPGEGANVIYDGSIMPLEKLGNYTYGYIGFAKGIPLPLLIAGSYYAAGFPTGGSALSIELADWEYVAKGYYAYP